ncbi:MAG: hypothetical protein MRZ90_00310, partial [Candidatus Gastranaerophilales bacterium]|nr:hypothetical protein [Candidatus Gastranaerophilales bacterium]
RLPDNVSLADFRTGEAPGSEKPEPASPKGDRRSVLSEKEIQDSDNCSNLRMGCICCYYQINNRTFFVSVLYNGLRVFNNVKKCNKNIEK